MDVRIGNVNEKNVLLNRVADVAVAVGIGKFSNFTKLRRSDASAKNGSANVIEASLLLLMNAEVIAMRVGGNLFSFGGIQVEADLPLEFREEAVCSPAVLQEKVFQTSLVAALAKHFAGAKDLCNATRDGND